MSQGVIIAVKPSGTRNDYKLKSSGKAAQQKTELYFIEGTSIGEEAVFWFEAEKNKFKRKEHVTFVIEDENPLEIKGATNVNKVKSRLPDLDDKGFLLQWFAASALFLFAVVSLSRK